jgi:hypothetical protein
VECARQFEYVFRILSPVNEGTSVWKTLPSTWLFMTREGTCGILQITEVQESAKRLTIRYKVVAKLGGASSYDSEKTNAGES